MQSILSRRDLLSGAAALASVAAFPSGAALAQAPAPTKPPTPSESSNPGSSIRARPRTTVEAVNLRIHRSHSAAATKENRDAAGR
jgi:hypothetical protein